jgi:hypothetical protein
MLDSDFLWRISGGDYSVISVCEQSIQKKFAGVGLVVLIISLLCFLSSFYSLYVLFGGSILLSFPIAIFFSWMITNIYIVLLTTLQKNLLPHVKSGGSVYASLAIRIAFLIFFSILISKPIEVFLFRSNLNREMAEYKSKIVNEFIQKTNTYYSNEEKEINKKIKDCKEINSLNISIDCNIDLLNSKLIELINEKDRSIIIMRTACEQTQFYIEEIKILSTRGKHIYSWLITLIIIVVFLLPAILKYYISETSSYYARKAKIEKDIIEANYNKTKILFTELLYAVSGKNIHFEEKYTDPPFNTTPIVEDKNFSDENDFLNLIYRA